MISFNEIDCNLINLNRIGGKMSRKPDPTSVRSLLINLIAGNKDITAKQAMKELDQMGVTYNTNTVNATLSALKNADKTQRGTPSNKGGNKGLLPFFDKESGEFIFPLNADLKVDMGKHSYMIGFHKTENKMPEFPTGHTINPIMEFRLKHAPKFTIKVPNFGEFISDFESAFSQVPNPSKGIPFGNYFRTVKGGKKAFEYNMEGKCFNTEWEGGVQFPRGRKKGQLPVWRDSKLDDLKIMDLSLPVFMKKSAAIAEIAKMSPAKQSGVFIREMETRGFTVYKIALKAYYIALGEYKEDEVNLAA
jgi:hypothetical protein